jgi:hypothetical protein
MKPRQSYDFNVYCCYQKKYAIQLTSDSTVPKSTISIAEKVHR